MKEVPEIRCCGECMCYVGGTCERLEDASSWQSPPCDWATEPWREHYTEEGWARHIWDELTDVTVDEHSCIDVPYDDPYLGHFPVGTYNEDIWHAIEEAFEGVAVYKLMYEE